MGLFNEHSSNHYQFVKGIQGAPGVGFNLTADGNYDMVGKKLTNVGAPTSDTDSATKKYVDTHSGGGKTSLITVDSNIDMKSQYSIKKLKTPSDNDDVATKKYVDDSKVDGSVFLKLDGTRTMTGNLNMNNQRILNIPAPTGNNQPTPLAYTDLAYLKVDGSNKMTNDLNMDNKKIINLITPTNNSDATPKKYVDDSISNQDFSSFLKKDGSNQMSSNLDVGGHKITNLFTPTNAADATPKKYVDDSISNQDFTSFFKKDGSNSMTSDLDVGGHKIINLEDPASEADAVNKKYVDSHIHQTHVQPSHYKNEFDFLMSSPTQWTDEIDNRTSFVPKKIDDLPTRNGNFHDYNHKVLYMNILKNFQGGYKYKMGLNFYRLVGGADYTLCLEILNIDYQLWHKTQISVDDNSSQGLQLGNVSVKKLQHRFIDLKGHSQFMYYHKVLINFKKLTTGNRFFIHILVNIPNNGNDLSVYPMQFSGVYMIAYGIMSKVSNIDPDKVYDFHTAFDIKPTQVKYNVDINANNKKILNITLDKRQDTSAATVGMVKELFPFTKNYVYKQYFEEFYDFTDANNYRLNKTSSGVVFNSLLPNITFTNKHLSDIKKDGLNVKNYTITYNPSGSFTNYTLCFVFYHWPNKDFALVKKNSDNNDDRLLSVTFTKAAGFLSLISNLKRDTLTLPSNFNGKKIVLWLAQSVDTIVTKANISNYSSTLTLNNANYTNDQDFEFTTDDGVLNKIMFSPNFYDFDSEQFHRVMMQEKINGSYVL